jgi:hypothetical protein
MHAADQVLSAAKKAVRCEGPRTDVDTTSARWKYISEPTTCRQQQQQ